MFRISRQRQLYCVAGIWSQLCVTFASTAAVTFTRQYLVFVKARRVGSTFIVLVVLHVMMMESCIVSWYVDVLLVLLSLSWRFHIAAVVTTDRFLFLLSYRWPESAMAHCHLCSRQRGLYFSQDLHESFVPSDGHPDKIAPLLQKKSQHRIEFLKSIWSSFLFLQQWKIMCVDHSCVVWWIVSFTVFDIDG